MKDISKIALLLCIILVGCSSSDEVKVVVAPLTPIISAITPQIVWQKRVGDGVDNYYSKLKPAVMDGKVFVASRFGVVEALDQNTGKQIWRKDFTKLFKDHTLSKNKGALLSGGILAFDKRVFVGSESGLLGALNSETGSLLWHQNASGELLSSPIIGEDQLVMQTGAGTVDSFNYKTGLLLWSYKMTLPRLTLRGTGSPFYAIGGFFIGMAGGKVGVIIKDNGQLAWEQTISTPKGGTDLALISDVDVQPQIVDDKIYAINYKGNLVSMELHTGQINWYKPYSSVNELIVNQENIYLIDEHSFIYSVDKGNGLEKWVNVDFSNRDLTSPALIKNYIVTGDLEGYLHFIRTTDGVEVGRILIDKSGLYSQPVVFNNMIYVQARNGSIAAVTL